MPYHLVTLPICLVLLLLTINDVINLEITEQNNDDDHMENGADQTAVIDRMTERHSLDHETLKLPKFPVKPESTNAKAASIKLSAVKFLLNVYENNEKKLNERIGAAEFNLTSNDLRLIDQSDTILTFPAQQSHKGLVATNDSMWFDIDAVPPKGEMTSAQLRLYRDANSKNLQNRGDFTVKVYRVLHKQDGEREMQLIDAVNTTAGQEGWITLNVTQSMLYWIKHPGDNNDLYLSVHPVDRSSQQTKPEDIGIVGFEGDAEHQPFIVGFFGRNAGLIQPTLRSFKDYDNKNKKRDISKQNLTSSCYVENHYVSFENLRWHDWIIAPMGYNANYCRGECTYPPHAQTPMTYHAIVLGRENQLYPEKMGKPCCAPTKLSALTVLYVTDKTVTLSTWGNMTVEACGCI